MNDIVTLQWLNPLYSISGFCVGALVGMTGVGGGSLMTPLLILLFGIHPATAVGTDLLYAAVTKTGGTFVHGAYRTIDWRIVGRLAAGSLPATCLTIAVMSRTDLGGDGARNLINSVLSGALILTAGVLVFRRAILELYAARVGELKPRTTMVATVIVGALLGRAGLDLLGRRGRHRRHRLDPALPASADAPDRGLRYRPCRAARLWPAESGIGCWAPSTGRCWHPCWWARCPASSSAAHISVRIPDRILRLLLAAVLLLVAGKLSLGRFSSMMWVEYNYNKHEK